MKRKADLEEARHNVLLSEQALKAAKEKLFLLEMQEPDEPQVIVSKWATHYLGIPIDFDDDVPCQICIKSGKVPKLPEGYRDVSEFQDLFRIPKWEPKRSRNDRRYYHVEVIRRSSDSEK